MVIVREDPPWISDGGAGAGSVPVPGMEEVTVREEDLFDYYEPLHGRLVRVIAASGLGAVMFNHRFFASAAVSDRVEDIRAVMAALPAHGIAADRLCFRAFSGGRRPADAVPGRDSGCGSGGLYGRGCPSGFL